MLDSWKISVVPEQSFLLILSHPILVKASCGKRSSSLVTVLWKVCSGESHWSHEMFEHTTWDEGRTSCITMLSSSWSAEEVVDSPHDENDIWHVGELSSRLNGVCRSWTSFWKIERHELIDDFLAPVTPERELRVLRFLVGEDLFVDLNPLERWIIDCWSFDFNMRSRCTNAGDLERVHNDSSSLDGGVRQCENDAESSPLGKQYISCGSAITLFTIPIPCWSCMYQKVWIAWLGCLKLWYEQQTHCVCRLAYHLICLLWSCSVAKQFFGWFDNFDSRQNIKWQRTDGRTFRSVKRRSDHHKLVCVGPSRKVSFALVRNMVQFTFYITNHLLFVDGIVPLAIIVKI